MGKGHHDTVVDRLWTYDLANTTWRASGFKEFFPRAFRRPILIRLSGEIG